MTEPKPFASLSSGLLARKGMAKPAMRPQAFGHSTNLDDLGWNDMGYSRPAPPVPSPYEAPHEEHVPSPISALTPMGGDYKAGEEDEFETPPVVEQQRAIEATFAAPVESPLAVKAKKPALPEPGEEAEAAIGSETAISPEAEPAIEPEAAPEPEAEIVRPIIAAAPIPVVHRPRRSRAGAKEKAAFTLRLDGARHLKLRLACAVSGRSAQQLVTEALDQLLHSLPEVEALADQLPAKKARN